MKIKLFLTMLFTNFASIVFANNDEELFKAVSNFSQSLPKDETVNASSFVPNPVVDTTNQVAQETNFIDKIQDMTASLGQSISEIMNVNPIVSKLIVISLLVLFSIILIVICFLLIKKIKTKRQSNENIFANTNNDYDQNDYPEEINENDEFDDSNFEDNLEYVEDEYDDEIEPIQQDVQSEYSQTNSIEQPIVDNNHQMSEQQEPKSEVKKVQIKKVETIEEALNLFLDITK